MIPHEHVAHELAMAYIHNRYSAEVVGELSISNHDDRISGTGRVWTTRLPGAGEVRTVRVPTGERRFFGLIEKTTEVDVPVDELFRQMATDYRHAFGRLLHALGPQ